MRARSGRRTHRRSRSGSPMTRERAHESSTHGVMGAAYHQGGVAPALHPGGIMQGYAEAHHPPPPPPSSFPDGHSGPRPHMHAGARVAVPVHVPVPSQWEYPGAAAFSHARGRHDSVLSGGRVGRPGGPVDPMAGPVPGACGPSGDAPGSFCPSPFGVPGQVPYDGSGCEGYMPAASAYVDDSFDGMLLQGPARGVPPAGRALHAAASVEECAGSAT